MSALSKFGCIAVAVCLSACATTAQYTSGSDYLAGYSNQTLAHTSHASTIDSDIRDIANVEPNLRFPARIGLARIHRGSLAAIPEDEAESWRAAAETLGPEFGNFIPVSPLVANMVTSPSSRKDGTVVDHIRRGAARQHLDYVITYEVTDKAESDGNALRLADLTILGLFVLPSRDLKAEASASAILLDVRNGYPYLTGSTFADKNSLSTVVGKGDRKDKLKTAARRAAVADIAEEFAEGLRDLKLVADGMQIAENRARQSSTLNYSSVSNR